MLKPFTKASGKAKMAKGSAVSVKPTKAPAKPAGKAYGKGMKGGKGC